jgi:hypothetical protein
MLINDDQLSWDNYSVLADIMSEISIENIPPLKEWFNNGLAKLKILAKFQVGGNNMSLHEATNIFLAACGWRGFSKKSTNYWVGLNKNGQKFEIDFQGYITTLAPRPEKRTDTSISRFYRAFLTKIDTSSPWYLNIKGAAGVYRRYLPLSKRGNKLPLEGYLIRGFPAVDSAWIIIASMKRDKMEKLTGAQATLPSLIRRMQGSIDFEPVMEALHDPIFIDYRKQLETVGLYTPENPEER